MMIRPAKPEDLPWITALLAENGQRIDGVAYDDFSGIVLVAEDNGEIVGMIWGVATLPVAFIPEFAVARHRQNDGIGRRLLEAMELLFRASGCRVWFGWCDQKNDKVLRGMTAMGGEVTGPCMGLVKRL